MDNTIDSLTYKGSIPEAISQSRREKKLFVIYISCKIVIKFDYAIYVVLSDSPTMIGNIHDCSA
jgi:hypothetical protein